MASLFECAAFSLYVYRDQNQPALPNGWSILSACPDELQYDGYYGMAFIKLLQQEDGFNIYDVVISHRGTVITKADLWNDFEIFLGKVPDQFSKGASLFSEYVRQLFKKNYPGQNNFYGITHTGHSLGAALAEICVAASFADGTQNSSAEMAITFESPGSKPIIADMEKKGILRSGSLSYAQRAINTALADVDAINTCNEQVALQSYSINVTPIGYDYELDSRDAGIMPPGITLYVANYTFCDQHKMLKMYQYWKDTEENSFLKNATEQDAPWPIGLENGYQCYLNYDLRQGYWDGYIQYIWDNNPDIHAQYKNDIDQWSLFFRSNLISTKQEKSRYRLFDQDSKNPKKLEEAGRKEQLSSEENASSWCAIA